MGRRARIRFPAIVRQAANRETKVAAGEGGGMLGAVRKGAPSE